MQKRNLRSSCIEYVWFRAPLQKARHGNCTLARFEDMFTKNRKLKLLYDKYNCDDRLCGSETGHNLV